MFLALYDCARGHRVEVLLRRREAEPDAEDRCRCGAGLACRVPDALAFAEGQAEYEARRRRSLRAASKPTGAARARRRRARVEAPALHLRASDRELAEALGSFPEWRARTGRLAADRRASLARSPGASASYAPPDSLARDAARWGRGPRG